MSVERYILPKRRVMELNYAILSNSPPVSEISERHLHLHMHVCLSAVSAMYTELSSNLDNFFKKTCNKWTDFG